MRKGLAELFGIVVGELVVCFIAWLCWNASAEWLPIPRCPSVWMFFLARQTLIGLSNKRSKYSTKD